MKPRFDSPEMAPIKPTREAVHRAVMAWHEARLWEAEACGDAPVGGPYEASKAWEDVVHQAVDAEEETRKHLADLIRRAWKMEGKVLSHPLAVRSGELVIVLAPDEPDRTPQILLLDPMVIKEIE